MTSQDQGWRNQSGADELLVLSSSTGLKFMQLFVDTLADCFEADLVTIGELMVNKVERINVLAGVFDGKPLQGFDYEACVTPCVDVIKTSERKVFLCRVQEGYPQDEMFVEEGINSYIGFPLKNNQGEAIGLIQASWRREIEQEEADHVMETIGLFVNRLSTELTTVHDMRILAALAEGSSNTGNLDALRLLCIQIQAALKIRVAFIAECMDGDDNQFRILTFCQDGKIATQAEGKVYPYQGTPCIHLKERDTFLIANNLAEAFPQQEQFKTEGLTSYLGVNIHDDSGAVIGHFALQNDREVLETTLKSDLFKLLSHRAGLELRQFKAEQRRQSQAAETPSIACEIHQRLATIQQSATELEGHINTPHRQGAAATNLKTLQHQIADALGLLRQLEDSSKDT